MKKLRMKTRDAAFTFRMGAGFPGDINRTHPVTIEPCLISVATPPTKYGQAVLLDAANGVRPFAAADQSDTVAAGWGLTVRPYPTQQSTASNFGQADFGDATPPVKGVIDVMRSGFMMVKLPAGGSPIKGAPVYVWSVASTGSHVIGGIEAAASAGNTTKLLNAFFNGPPDANGIVEIEFNV